MQCIFCHRGPNSPNHLLEHFLVLPKMLLEGNLVRRTHLHCSQAAGEEAAASALGRYLLENT